MENDARLAARISVLEVMLSWMMANFAMLTPNEPEKVLATVRAILWEGGPKAPAEMPAAVVKAFRVEWESRLDALFDDAEGLVRKTQETRE
jgi:hypothetical protein